MAAHRIFMLHRDGILASDGGDFEFVAQYMNDPPETCTYQYAYGRICGAGAGEHKWIDGRTHIETEDWSIFDHSFITKRRE